MSKSLGNVVAPWEVHRPLRRRRLPLVLLHLEAAVGRLPLLGRRGRRERVRRSCASCGTSTPSTSSTPTPASERERRRPRDLDRWLLLAPGRDRRDGRASASTPTTRRSPDARSRTSSRTSRTGTCGARAGASGTASAPRSRRCARRWSRSRSCSRRSRRSSPTRSTTTSTARCASVHLCDFPDAGERDLELEFAMATARETVRARPRRAQPGRR